MDIHWVSFLIGFVACAIAVWLAAWFLFLRSRSPARNYGMGDLPDDDMAGADRP